MPKEVSHRRQDAEVAVRWMGRRLENHSRHGGQIARWWAAGDEQKVVLEIVDGRDGLAIQRCHHWDPRGDKNRRESEVWAKTGTKIERAIASRDDRGLRFSSERTRPVQAVGWRMGAKREVNQR